MSRVLIALLLVLAGLVIASVFVGDGFVDQLRSPGNLLGVATMLGVLVLALGKSPELPQKGSQILTYVAVWIAIACAAALFYRYFL